MPFVFRDQTTPTGMFYLHIDVSDRVEFADGEALMAQLQRPELRHGLVLSEVAKGTQYSPEVRKYFPSINGHFRALAAVVTSPIVRGAINLMIRLSNSHESVRMFTTRAEALEWLEQQPTREPAL